MGLFILTLNNVNLPKLANLNYYYIIKLYQLKQEKQNKWYLNLLYRKQKSKQ